MERDVFQRISSIIHTAAGRSYQHVALETSFLTHGLANLRADAATADLVSGEDFDLFAPLPVERQRALSKNTPKPALGPETVVRMQSLLCAVY